jgi:hypothetical protein
MGPDQARRVDASLRRFLAQAQGSSWQHDHDALRALDDVRIGDDVSGRIDDHARPHAVLAHEERRLLVSVITGGQAVTGDLDLHDRRRNAIGELRERAVELAQDAGRFTSRGACGRRGMNGGGQPEGGGKQRDELLHRCLPMQSSRQSEIPV